MSDTHDAEQWRKWKSALDAPVNRITELERELAASKQREAKLREALECISKYMRGEQSWEHGCITNVSDENAVTPAKVASLALKETEHQ